MSFFSKLFTRNITFIEHFCRDTQYDDILHVYGAIRIMPDEGDSFDIWRHSVIDLNNYSVTNGLEQRGNEFSMNSPFAKRCLEHMSAQLNRKLEPYRKKEDEQDDHDESYVNDDYLEPETEPVSLENNCELPITELDLSDTDTGEPKKLPKSGLVFMKNNVGDRERFTVQLCKSGRGLDVHQMSGVADYFRYVLWLKRTNRIIVTYRKTNWAGTGGMAFFVLDGTTGMLLHNAMIK